MSQMSFLNNKHPITEADALGTFTALFGQHDGDKTVTNRNMGSEGSATVCIGEKASC